MGNDLVFTNTLLHNAKDICLQYEQRQKDLALDGRLYNIFYVLGLWSEETKFHSVFLADLLNPKGWHAQGSIFLEEFLKILGLENYKYDSAEVEIEKNIGKISKDKLHGGRIDIFIRLKNPDDIPFSIIIENKIYAKDQINQLIRYKNFAENYYANNYKILYLSLDGKNPQKKSVGFDCERNKDPSKVFWTNIAYSIVIKKWIMQCIERVYNKPNIQIVIQHYYNLLTELIGEGGDKEMTSDIQNLLLENHNLLYAKRLVDEISSVENEIIINNFQQICTNISPKECTSFTFNLSPNDSSKWQEFSYTLKKSDIRIVFQFDGKFGENFFFGIPTDDNLNIETRNTIRHLTIGERKNQGHNKYWLWSYYCDEKIDDVDFCNWDILVYDLILNKPDQVQGYFENIINEIIQALKESGIL